MESLSASSVGFLLNSKRASLITRSFSSGHTLYYELSVLQINNLVINTMVELINSKYQEHMIKKAILYYTNTQKATKSFPSHWE